MEISRDSVIFSIIEKQGDLIKENDNNWVIDIYNEDTIWTELEFKNFTSVMRSLNFEEDISKQYLEVSVGENILKINNTPNITKYCLTDTHKNLQHEWLRKKEYTSDIIQNLFDATIKMSVYNITENSEPDKWEEMRKKYKLFTTISYKDTLNDVIYKVNIVKDNDDDFYSLKQSGIIRENQKYEFQLIINNKDVALQSIIRAIQSITLSTLILSKPQQANIVEQYYKLIKDDVFINIYNKNKGEVPLLTPKPVTLERANMIDPSEYGSVSILSEYTVTEKADGERLLMYINNEGKVYLINNTFMVQDTGIKASKEAYNSLIDGEYIACNKRLDISNKSLFAAFDIYYMNGKKVTSLPLIDKKECRYEILKNIEKMLNDKTNEAVVNFIVKTHYYSDTILKDCKNILENTKKYPYEVDGLIFTPAKLAVYSYYVNKPVQITDNMKWDRVFKWKPVEQNTIDFLVQEGNDLMINGQKYKELKLYVGYNASQWEEISPMEGVKIRYDKETANKYKLQRNSYIPKLFKPTIYYSQGVEKAYIKVNTKGEMRADNGDMISGESIVEFKYILDESIPISNRWVPLRVREDKTRIFKQGKLSKTANELGVAINIWRSIHLPVTKAMIMGNEPVFSKEAPDDIEERLLETDDIYYSRDIPRDSLLSVSMLNFHNQGIKRDLYMKTPKRGTLLELACGEFGDMNRFLDAGYNFVLGVDLVKKNIINPRSGAWSRIIKRFNQYRRKVEGVDKIKYTDMVAVTGDCAVNLKDGSAANVLEDKESEYILRVVLNRQGSVPSHLKYIAGKGAAGFDTVSCQFAIHYFFQSEEKLDGFLSNVSMNLRKDGMFICTFMDGKKVEEEINNNGGDMVEGRKNLSKDDIINSVPVWAIIRRYNKDSDTIYGKKIDVYIENTQKFIPEFMVNYEGLVEKAKTFNLELYETEMFGESFNKIKSIIPDNDETKMNLHEHIALLDKDEIQKRFSFLNRWVIFKKK
jgi:hypothetical protein